MSNWLVLVFVVANMYIGLFCTYQLRVVADNFATDIFALSTRFIKIVAVLIITIYLNRDMLGYFN